jgi:hypothetical protein
MATGQTAAKRAEELPSMPATGLMAAVLYHRLFDHWSNSFQYPATAAGGTGRPAGFRFDSRCFDRWLF